MLRHGSATAMSAPAGSARLQFHSACAGSGSTRNQCSRMASASSVASEDRAGERRTRCRQPSRAASSARQNDGRDRDRDRKEQVHRPARKIASRDSAGAPAGTRRSGCGTPRNTLSLALCRITHSTRKVHRPTWFGRVPGQRQHDDADGEQRSPVRDRGSPRRHARSASSRERSAGSGSARGPVT